MIRRYLAACGIGALVVALDLATKRWAAQELSDGGVTLIDGLLSLTFAENPGGAFSLFPDAGPVLAIAAIVVSVVILAVLARPRPVAEVVAFGLVLGGALGNLADRVFRGPGLLDGEVIDWVNLGPIPTFNLADAAVTVAVALLLLHGLVTSAGD